MNPGIDYIAITTTFFCHDGQGNYFLNKRSNNCRDEHGRWDPGGGRVEFGDTALQTLTKEIKEEYCSTVKEVEFLGFRDVFREQDGKPTHWLSLDFRVLIDRSTAANGEPHKFSQVGWFRMDALPSPLHSQFSLAHELYKDRLV